MYLKSPKLQCLSFNNSKSSRSSSKQPPYKLQYLFNQLLLFPNIFPPTINIIISSYNSIILSQPKKKNKQTMSNDQITIQIQTSPKKLKKKFPDDPKGDIEIIFKTKVFKLQKAHLRLQSTYFRNTLNNDRSILEIKENFNEQFFSNLLLCFYGDVLKIERKDALEYYPIVHFLEIQTILKILRKDMMQSIDLYSFFRLFNLAYSYSDQLIFEKCLNKLESTNFILIQTEKEELLKVSEQLFKFIIKSHNKLSKSKLILNAYQINNLLKQYCRTHKLSDEYSNHLKFQMIDKANLTSQEYQQIFINQNKLMNTSNKKQSSKSSDDNPKVSTLQNTIKVSSNQLQKSFQLEMETTFLKKLGGELMQKQNQLQNQIQKLNGQNINQTQKSTTIINQFNEIKQKINDADSQQNYLQEQIQNIDVSLELLQKNFDDQSQKFEKLMNDTQQMMKKYEKSKQQTPDNNYNSLAGLFGKNKKNQKIDFQYTTANDKKVNKSTTSLSNQLIDQHKSKNKYVSLTNVEIESPTHVKKYDMYLEEDRIQFLAKSYLIRNITELQSLASIIADKNKILQLKLIYRASKQIFASNTKYSKGNEQVAEGLRKKSKNKDKLLFLCRTESDKLIGGYTSIPLNLYELGDYKDENAFIFSVTHCKKFKVKIQQVADAILVHKGYIICFGTDLMLSDKLFQMENYCGWPNTYENYQNLEERASDWFVGNSQFSIKEIECFRVDDLVEDNVG